MRQTQRSPEGPRHLHTSSALSRCPPAGLCRCSSPGTAFPGQIILCCGGGILAYTHEMPAAPHPNWDNQIGLLTLPYVLHLLRTQPQARTQHPSYFPDTYVWTFNLKTKEKAAKWILAAVALLLQV